MKITNNRELIKFFPRESTKFVKEYFQNKKINVIEVGTFFGENANSLNKELNIEKLFLIDPYKSYSEYKNSENDKTNVLLDKAKQNAHKINNKGNEVWIEKMSSEVNKEDIISFFPIQFIYIDGNHEYEFVKEDLIKFYNILQVGGILAGHDIEYHGVSKAVIEFVKENNLEIQFGDRRDWWIIKK